MLNMFRNRQICCKLLARFLVVGCALAAVILPSCTPSDSQSDSFREHDRVLTDTNEIRPGYMTLFDNGVAIAVEPGAFPEEVESLEVEVDLFGQLRADEIADGAEWDLEGVHATDRFVEVRLSPHSEQRLNDEEFMAVVSASSEASFWIIIPPPGDVDTDDLSTVIFVDGDMITGDDQDMWDWLFEAQFYDTQHNLVVTRMPYIGGEAYPTRVGLVEDRLDPEVRRVKPRPIIDELLEIRLAGETPEAEDEIEERPLPDEVATQQQELFSFSNFSYWCRSNDCPFVIECWLPELTCKHSPVYDVLFWEVEKALADAHTAYQQLAANRGPGLSTVSGSFQYVICSEADCNRCNGERGGQYRPWSKTAAVCIDTVAKARSGTLSNPNTDQIRRTTAHELLHAFQYGYDSCLEEWGCFRLTTGDRWVTEGTARYLEGIQGTDINSLVLASRVEPKLEKRLTSNSRYSAYDTAHFWWDVMERNGFSNERLGFLFQWGLSVAAGKDFVPGELGVPLSQAHWDWVLNVAFRGDINPTGKLNRCEFDDHFGSTLHSLKLNSPTDTASETIAVPHLAAAAIEIELPSGGLGGKNRYYVIEVEDLDSRYDFVPNSNVALYTETAEAFPRGKCKAADGDDLSSSIRREKDFVPVEFSEDTFDSDSEPRVTKFRGHVSVRGSSSPNHHSAYVILTNPTVTADPDSGLTSVLANYEISVEPAKEHYNVDFERPAQTATYEVGRYFRGVLDISTPDFRDPPENLEFALLVDGNEVDLDDTITLDVSDDSVDYRWTPAFSRENLCPGSSSQDFDLEVVMTKPSSGDPSVRSQTDDGYETKSAPLTLSVDPSIGLSSEIEPANVNVLNRSQQFLDSSEDTGTLRDSAARNSEYLFDASGDLNDGTPPTFDGLQVNGFAEHCDREWDNLKWGMKWYAHGDVGGTVIGDSNFPWQLHVEPEDLRTQTGLFEDTRFVLTHDDFPNFEHPVTVRPCVMATYVERQEMMVDGEYYPTCDDPIWDILDEMECNPVNDSCRMSNLDEFRALIDDYIADAFFGHSEIADPVGGFPYQSPRDRLGMTPDPDVANPEEYSGRFLNYVDSLQTYSEVTLSGSATSLDFLDEAYGQIRQLGPEATVLEHFAVAEFANIMGSLITLYEAPDAGGFNALRSLGFVIGHHNPNRLFEEVSLQRPIQYAFRGFITALDTYVGAHGNISAPYASNPAEYNLDEAAMLRVKKGAFAGFLLGVYEELAALE